MGAHCRCPARKVKPGALVTCLLFALAQCQVPGKTETPSVASRPAITQAITQADAQQVLAVQAARWNAGDLPAFVATYWDGPELTFLGSEGLTRGRADLLAKYQHGYPDAASRGVLSFAVVEFRPLGTDHALLLGSYHLQRSQPAHGWFSLVMARQDGQLVILHDHSSAAK